jgi:hypothetical protein
LKRTKTIVLLPAISVNEKGLAAETAIKYIKTGKEIEDV